MSEPLQIEFVGACSFCGKIDPGIVVTDSKGNSICFCRDCLYQLAKVGLEFLELSTRFRPEFKKEVDERKAEPKA